MLSLKDLLQGKPAPISSKNRQIDDDEDELNPVSKKQKNSSTMNKSKNSSNEGKPAPGKSKNRIDEGNSAPNKSKNSTQKQSFKRSDFKKAKLLSLGFPQKVETNDHSKKKYLIQIKYQDNQDKIRIKNVRFGKDNVEDYIDHRDDSKRLRCINKMKNDDNFLHPNFYRLYLLNSKNIDMYEAYKDLTKALNVNDF